MIFPFGWLLLGDRVRRRQLRRALLQAYPANSVVVKHWAKSSFQGNARALEAFCRQHRTALIWTNENVLAYVGVVATSWMMCAVLLYWQRKENKKMKLTQDGARYHVHTEHTLLWLYSVYYNHPTYAEDARSRVRNQFDFGVED